jgi:hypothetical protein
MVCLAVAVPSAGQVLISEFQAADGAGFPDEDGEAGDWIEIHNPSRTGVSLAGWHLTDNPLNLAQWTFPATNLGPGQFLVVFASNKNRRLPGRPLHTNFKLNSDGEYLALVKPDGQTVAHDFPPSYPPQRPETSYGFPWISSEALLLSGGAQARLLVPRDGALGQTWILPDYDDSAWPSIPTGMDLDASMRAVNASVYMRVPFVVEDPDQVTQLTLRLLYDDGVAAFLNGQLIVMRNAPVESSGGLRASSIGDWSASGEQGARHWFYGFCNRAAETDASYNVSDFQTTDPQWTWNGGAWVLGPSNPPWDTITADTWRPNGTNSGGAHWVIRRWACPVSGSLVCHVSFAKQDTTCGNGATLRVFQNGRQQFSRTIAAGDTTGIRADVALPSVQAGDLIDFALDPLGTDRTQGDSCDTCTFSVEIEQLASAGLDWNSIATVKRSATELAIQEEFDLTRYRDLLVPGTNVLAFQGLNASVTDPSLVLLPELTATRAQADLVTPVYFAAATPGAPNGQGATNLGPISTHAGHLPLSPNSAESVTVTARITATSAPIRDVILKYRVMFGLDALAPMFDDGLHSDGAAQDGTFGARIPASVARAGQMIRYFVAATDTRGNETRLPAFANKASSQYFGLVVADPSLTNSRLPVLHWFIQSPSAANSDLTARASIFYNDEFYDNIGVNLHGQSTRDFPKKSYDLDFNPDHKFSWSKDAPRVDDLNLLTTWADKSYLRNILAYDTYREAGALGHFALAVRVQQNGAFHSVANLVENGDDNFLKRLGLDPAGALYKMYNAAESTAGSEKKTRKSEDRSDLQALISGMANATTRQTFLFDNLDIPEIVNFLAARAITADTDCCHKNYYLYRDSDGSGQWQAMPWDVDLSFGRVWTCATPCLNYFDPVLYTNQSIFTGANNRIFAGIYDIPGTRQMFLRRVRTLMDALLQSPGIATNLDAYRLKSLALRDQIAPDAALDLAKWGTWGAREGITQAVNRIWTEFLPGRRAYMFRTLAGTTRSELPTPQPTNAIVQFGALEFRSNNGNPLQEWLSLTNPNSYAVDISGWRLGEGVRFTFKPGTVIPARSNLFVSPDVKSFLERSSSPRGGERQLVVGPYNGNLSAWGETLTLSDTPGRVVSTHAFTGDPSPAQRYLRVTEINFHPAAWLADPNRAAQEFEFLELRNIGPTVLELSGVRFTFGIVFDFSSGALTRLEPGARLLVVRDAAAMTARYGARLPIAGQFLGSLDNGGERLRLEDAFREKIVEFAYGSDWQPAADGSGSSLAIREGVALTFPDASADPANWSAAKPTPGLSNDSLQPPVAAPDGLLAQLNQPSGIPLSTLLYNDTDAEGAELTFADANPKSEFGGTIVRSGSQLVYSPPLNFEGADRFTYTIRNRAGASATAQVEVLVYDGALPPEHRVAIQFSRDGYRLRYTGEPGRTCSWERSTDLRTWETRASALIPPHGVCEFLETEALTSGAAYRAALK